LQISSLKFQVKQPENNNKIPSEFSQHKAMKYKLLLLALTLVGMGCKKEKNRICEIYAGSMGYEIGTITQGFTRIGKITYSYSYSINGVGYKGKEKEYGIGEADDRFIGKDYLVVYKIDDPGESDLNRKYPIESQADFQQLLIDFASDPPEPNWPKCK
jgi:hypothetical protein